MRLLALSLLLAGCADADPADVPAPTPTVATADGAAGDDTPDAGTPDAPPATEPPAPEASGDTGTDWEGRYTWSEGAGNYSYGYELDLAYAGPDNPDQLYGTLSIGGTQVSTQFDVLATMLEDDGLEVILIDYREGNTSTLQKPGDTLFTLRWEDAGDLGDEAGDRVLRTYWAGITPTGAGDAAIGDASTLAFYPADE